MDYLSRIDEAEARMKNPLVLAYVGDTVYDLYYRVWNVKNSQDNVNRINQSVVGGVNAKAQAAAAHKLLDLLSDTELDIYKRGRNSNSATAPKNMSLADYRHATALEAVIGYLFLTGQQARLNEIFEIIWEEDK